MMSYYVGWQEVCVSGDIGRREVHYYLKRRDGASDLAVVGKEKSFSHMSYNYAIKNFSLLSLSNSSSLLKLRSRTQVIHWLNSIVPVSDSHPRQARGPIGGYLESKNTCDINSCVLKAVQMREQGKHATEFMWLGFPWMCRKKRKHYQSFNRNGVIVSVHEFVYVLAEEEKKLVAYLDDMYEDSRGNGMVVVRWFHKIDEVGIVLPHNYNDREILFSLCLQTLSIECIDGLASVLSPEHYEKLRNYTQVKPFVCRWQFDNDKVRPFDITQIKGYWGQDIMKHLHLPSCATTPTTCDSLKGEENDTSLAGSRPKKRLRLTKAGETYRLSIHRKETVEGVPNSLKEGCSDVMEKQSLCFTIGAHVEILSQDSGIRGCWLRATIIKKRKNKVKVQYQDIRDADDETKNLEEWVLAFKVAAVDAFGARISGRSILRPSPVSNMGCTVNVGCIVDAWWHNAWWEGIVVEKDSQDKLHVYLLGENQDMMFTRSDLRSSQEWLDDGWRKLRERPELVSALTAVMDDKHKQTAMSDGCVPNKNSSNTIRRREKITVVRDLLKDNSLGELRWKSSGKRSQGRRSPVLSYGNSRGDCVMTSRELFFPWAEVDDDNCKYSRDSGFTSVVSPLTSLVMSR